mgnify:CR=1 FL=1
MKKQPKKSGKTESEQSKDIRDVLVDRLPPVQLILRGKELDWMVRQMIICLCGHSEENLDDTAMGALFALDVTKTGNITKSGEIWRTKEQFIGKTGPLVIGDRVYSVDDGGIFYVNDLKTGALVGKTKIGTMGRGSPVYGDGKIYVVDGNGRWFIFAPDEAKGVKKIHSLRLEHGDVGATGGGQQDLGGRTRR